MATKTTVGTKICTRCHGRGRVPFDYDSEQLTVLDELQALGSRRAKLQAHRAYMRPDGRAELSEIYGSAQYLIGMARERGIRNEDIADALGVSVAAMRKIRIGQTGA